MNKERFRMVVGEDILSSDDDLSDDEFQALEESVEHIEYELSTNLYQYDLHKELVGIYVKTANLLSLCIAYKRFAEIFPLTEDLWMQWIKAEISVADDDDKKTILELFKRATKDYLSVKIWLEYVQFAMSHCELEETHAILENALSVAGLHFTDASLLWDILRELEIANLSITSKDTEEYKTQLNKVVDAFRRQLSVPLLNISSTYNEWQQFVEQCPEVDATIVETGYKKALENVEKYKVYEDRLMSGEDEELLDVYSEYIKSVNDPSLIMCLYERAIEKFCLRPQIWKDYLDYTLKLGKVCVGISERALRNATWCEELWCTRMRILEKFEVGNDEVTKCFENALEYIPNGLELWMDYISFTKRNTPNNLLKLLDYAEKQQIYDPQFKLKRYHALVCAKSSQLDRSRELWNALLLDPQAKKSYLFWLKYVRLERQYGTVSSARSVFNRAITVNTDWPQGIADEWIMFEREEGSLNDILKCHEKIAKFLPQKLQAQADMQAQLADTSTTHKYQSANDCPERKSRKRKSDLETNNLQTKKQKPEVSANKPYVVKNQGAPLDLNPEVSVFISNISPTVTQKHLSDFFSNSQKVTLATNNKGRSRCFAYVQFETPEESEAALKRDRTLFESRPIFISKCKTDKTERRATFKFSQTQEENKLFVKGLPVKYSKEDVEKLFMPYNFKAVRIVVHKSGQSKGLAYVEFENATDAANAMKATDNMTVENFIISVAISAPPPKDAKRIKAEPARHSRSRIQVPLIPRAAMKAQQTEKSGGSASASSKESGKVKPKSNSDFRNMLLNK